MVTFVKCFKSANSCNIEGGWGFKKKKLELKKTKAFLGVAYGTVEVSKEFSSQPLPEPRSCLCWSS